MVFCHTSASISHRYTHVPSLLNLPPISLAIPPFSPSQSPSLNSLSHTANSHQLSILQMVMYVSMLLCPYIPHFPSSPLPHIYKSVLYVWSSLQELAVKFLQTSHRLPGDCSKVERKPCFVLLRDYRKELYQVRSSTSISFYHNIQT